MKDVYDSIPSAVELTKTRCIPCEGNASPMNRDQVLELVKQLEGWEVVDGEIARTFAFKNYYETLAFVNAVGWIAHRENHHPDIRFGYKTCQVRYSTHAIGGISFNDFICAAKVNALI